MLAKRSINTQIKEDAIRGPRLGLPNIRITASLLQALAFWILKRVSAVWFSGSLKDASGIAPTVNSMDFPNGTSIAALVNSSAALDSMPILGNHDSQTT